MVKYLFISRSCSTSAAFSGSLRSATSSRSIVWKSPDNTGRLECEDRPDLRPGSRSTLKVGRLALPSAELSIRKKGRKEREQKSKRKEVGPRADKAREWPDFQKDEEDKRIRMQVL